MIHNLIHTVKRDHAVLSPFVIPLPADLYRLLPRAWDLLKIRCLAFALVALVFLYAAIYIITPFLTLQRHIRRARAIGLPYKVVPFPPGLFSFFLAQLLQRLGLLKPGSKFHKWLNMGRPAGYDMHQEMGDVFVTVNPSGLTLIVADPQVIGHVNSKRAQFSKTPNTGGESSAFIFPNHSTDLLSHYQHLRQKRHQRRWRSLALPSQTHRSGLWRADTWPGLDGRRPPMQVDDGVLDLCCVRSRKV